MSQKRIAKRSTVKPFVKVVNYKHMMPTRYNLDVKLNDLVNAEVVADPAKKKEAKTAIKKVFEEKYNAGQNKWFFQKLRF